jgi:sec-independent protein translocase protein TatC
MPQPIEDDLFRESTMTFGEHLEELRSCLFKAIYGLAAGFAVGLLIGSDVVAFIQTPLSEALSTYYQRESVKRVQGELRRLKDSPRALPWTDEEIENRVKNQNLLAEEVFVDPAELLQQLKAAYPGRIDQVQPPARDVSALDEQAADEVPPGMIRLFLWRPGKDDPRVRIKSLNAQEAFSVYVKASLLVGVLLASPWIFYQIWSFVAAGLYPHERHYVHVFLPVSLGLFLMGAALAFFAVFRPVLNFLLGFNATLGIDPDPRINEWLSFVLFLPLGFGIGFQLPLVMLFLERIGVFTVRNYMSQWRISVLVICVLAAILTPPDPYSMILMAAPLTILFFGGVLLCILLPRKRSPFGENG